DVSMYVIDICIVTHVSCFLFYFFVVLLVLFCFFFFFQAEDGIRDDLVTGVQTCALPILASVHFPPFKEATLPNGLQLVVIEHHEQPVISATLSFRAGGIYDPKGKEGLSDLAAELLSKGTDNRSAEQIAATIEGVGGTLSASSAEDFLTISAEALSDQAGLVFELLGDVTLHSTFPENEVG